MKKIDAHLHLIDYICGIGSEGELRDLHDGTAMYASGKLIRLIPEEYAPRVDGKMIVELMDKHNVEFGIALQGNYAGFQNLFTYEESKKYPNRILGAATLDPFFRNRQKVYENLFDTLGFKIIKMEVSNGSGLMANHPTVDLAGDDMDYIYSNSNNRNLIFYIDIGRPGNNCYQIDNLVKVIKKYPNMKFIVCHLTAPQHDQMNILEENMHKLCFDNVYFDIAALPNNSKQPYPFIESTEYIKKAISIVGSNKILWGSDFPAAMNFTSYENSYKYIEDSNILTKEEKENILYNNAYNLFKELL